MKIRCCTKTVFLKVLKLVMFVLLLICSLWFMKDAWDKFKAKATNFRLYSEFRYEVPTTVICFSPKQKPSGFKKHNITIMDFYYPEYYNLTNKLANLTWDQFENDIFYQLNIDFQLQVELNDKNKVKTNEWLYPMKEGKNGNLNGTFVYLTKMVTFYHGICYKITFDYATFLREPFFFLMFNVTDEDKPRVKLFLTSEENANGIISQDWYNGEPLELEFPHHDNRFRYGIGKSK